MSNDFLRLSCPYCGGSLCPDGELYRCADCGNRFEKKKSETDSEKIRSILDERKAEQVANIRRRLWEETHKEYISSDAILDAAQKILDILPEDRFANFYKAAVSEGYEELNRFLDNFDVSNADDLPLILDFSVKVMEELNINSVKALAERGLTGEAKIDCYSKIEAEAEKIQSGIYNTDVPRTVFLAYSSKDMKKVNEVAAYLESQGFSCFVALRNLRHGKGAKENYQAEIMNAIANCKCVVFISSENSRAMTCDAMRIEIPFLRKTYPDKPHIEFLLDEYGKGTMPAAKAMLKEYFKDLEFCTNLDDLGLRVFHAEADVNTGATAISKQQEEMMREIEALKQNQSSSSDSIEPMIKRANMFLADGDFTSASSTAERILDRDPECAIGYVIKLMAEMKVKKRSNLAKCSSSFESNANYKRAYKYADEVLKAELKKSADSVQERLKAAQIEAEYCKQTKELRNAESIKDYQDVIEALSKIGTYKDCEELIKKAEETIKRLAEEENRREEKQRIQEAKERIRQAEQEKQEEQRRREREAEEQRLAEKRKRKARLKSICIVTGKILGIAAVCGIIIAFFIWLFWPNRMTFTLNGDQESYTLSTIHNCTDQVIIPEKHDGKPVTSIGNWAFRDCSSLTSITIPSSVKSIGEDAFYDCSNLATVTFAENSQCSSIGDRAFYGCNSLENITIPSSVKNIGSSAFYYCSNLATVTFAENSQCSSIGSSAFYDCSSLTSITIPSSVTSIGGGAFSVCSSLESITIPSSVTSIGDSAFSGCSGLTSITIPSSVKNIGNYAFYDCSNLATVTFAENSQCSSIGDDAFYNCSSLTSITIPSSVTSIGEGAFYDCKSLTSITIPSSVTSIGEGAFYDCKSLTSITVPKGVTSIGSSAFRGCSGLTSITLPFVGATKGGTSNTHFGYIFGASSHSYNSSYVPSSLKTVDITGGTSIGNYAFDGCSGLTSITIPSSVTSIGYDAFRGCSSLTSITIPSSVTSIGEYAFSHCSSLTSITIPSSVTSISEYAFNECRSLNAVYITDLAAWCGIKFEGYNSNPLYHAHNLYINGELATDITIPSSVTNIVNSAFEYCSSLKSITIPSSVKNIGREAFFDCSNLATVTFAENSQCSSIGVNAFRYCSSLTSITFQGTKAQWNAISKGYLWNSDTDSYTIHCTDGKWVEYY